MKTVVYTCITGGYDYLKEVPKEFLDDSLDFVCYTDDPNLTSKTWKIRMIPDQLSKLTNVKKQRIIKICPIKFFPEYDASLWIDGSMEITGSITSFLKNYDLNKYSIWTLKHPIRNCIYEEEKVVLMAKKDSASITTPQIKKYLKERFPRNFGLAETRILYRDHRNKKIFEAMFLWANEVLKGSHRDQLSFNYVCWKCGLKYGEISKDDSRRTFKWLVSHPKETPKINLNIKDYKYPTVSVMITTHNRTRVACACIDALIQNLKYKGKLKWIICDDRSEEGHVEALVHQFKEKDVSEEDLIVCRTNEEHWGLGASMNNGLKKAFEIGNVVLTTEDDWYLHDEYNISEFVKIVNLDESIAGIRIGAMCPQCRSNSKNSKYSDFFKVEGGKDPNGKWYIFNNQVMIRNKRIFDKIGFMKENCSADEQEKDLTTKFNKLTDFGRSKNFQVLWPKSYDVGTNYGIHNPFYHIGESTTDGKHRVIKSEYKELNNKDLDEEFRKKFNVKDNKEKIIVSMTSYPKRISNVAISLSLLLTKQTLPPDEIHLWLAIEEFPNLENDLPDTLNQIIKINSNKIYLHWLEKNTYVHKRHEYFKIAKQNDCVFLIDDDVRYNDNLIKTVMDKHKLYPNSIICYTYYTKHTYIGKRIIYKTYKTYKPVTNIVRWCGQSMIPASLYPKEVLSEKNQEIRNKTSPISDECWLQPWIVYKNISIYYLSFWWGEDIDKNNPKENGLVKYSHEKESNGYERRDNWLNNVLNAYPELMKTYKKLFNYGK